MLYCKGCHAKRRQKSANIEVALFCLLHKNQASATLFLRAGNFSLIRADLPERSRK